MSDVKLDNSGRKVDIGIRNTKLLGYKQTVRTRILGNFARAQTNLETDTNLDIGNVKRMVICWQISAIILVG
jgi:hypothetical protein